MTTAWSGTDTSANISASGVTAATTSATQGAVRATTSAASGKVYVEYQLAVLAGAQYALGWANASAVLSTALGGADKNSVVFEPNTGTSPTLFNNSNLGSYGYLGAALLTVCQAVDLTNKLIWTRYNGDFWNGSATADPAAGTGGRSFSTINAGPWFPIFAANGSGASVAANFGAKSFGYPAPSGFAGLDSNAQAYVAASKVLGYAVEGPPLAAASASKLLGYAVEGPPLAAASVSKLLGYVVLHSPPLLLAQRDWPNPLRPRFMRPGDVWSANPANIPPAVLGAPFRPLDFPNPLRPRRLHDGGVWASNLATIVPAIAASDDVVLSILW